MEEPVHANESSFWDQVADWLLGWDTPDLPAWANAADSREGSPPPRPAAD